MFSCAPFAAKGTAALFVSILLLPLAAQGQNKFSPDLQNLKSSDQVTVIVQYKQMPDPRQMQLLHGLGVTLKATLNSVFDLVYSVPASALATLANDPNVIYVSPDRNLQASSIATSPQVVGLDYHRESMNLPSATPLDGSGVGVALIDSGLAPLTPLNVGGRPIGLSSDGIGPVSDLFLLSVAYSQDFTGSGSVIDRYGHGTFVAGIIAGNGSSSTGPEYSYTMRGIAPKVNLINLRVLDGSGAGTDSGVIEAIDRAIALKVKFNIREMNLSLGRPVFESYQLDPLCQAVEKAWKAGITVIDAAGNDGRDIALGTNGYFTINSPANDPYVITVGAMNTQGSPSVSSVVPTSYTSKGPSWGDWIAKPDLTAPGNLVLSLYAQGQTLAQTESSQVVQSSAYGKTFGSSESPAYIALSGTSVAAPMVTGTVALMLQQDPGLTPDQVKLRLMSAANKTLVQNTTVTDRTTGQVFQEEADLFTVGAGYLDVKAALASNVRAAAISGSAASPNVGVNDAGQVVLTSGTSSLYGSAVFSGIDGHGLPVIWGTPTRELIPYLPKFVYNQAAASQGSGAEWDSTAIWGSTVIWGRSAVWGSTVIWGRTGQSDSM